MEADLRAPAHPAGFGDAPAAAGGLEVGTSPSRDPPFLPEPASGLITGSCPMGWAPPCREGAALCWGCAFLAIHTAVSA